MTPRQAEEYLLGLELFGMRFGLDRMHKLMTALGMPQRRYASIHVVGSNGKSSTVRFIAALLERHGFRTGSYTSPHLRSFRERIELRGRPLDEAAFTAAVARARNAADLVERTLDPDDGVTQFEALTAAAYHALAAGGVEVAVIEAGLGGRYDATNVIPSRVQVLTGVGLEHTRWLGPTVSHIAEEKLAVVGRNGTLVVGDLPAEVRPLAECTARERGAALVRAPAPDRDLPLRAAGSFQRRNFAVARAAAEAFLGKALDESAVKEAGAQTLVPGRLEVVSRDPLTLLDGAHNPAGAVALADAVPEVVGDRRPFVLVLSVLDDKDAAGMLQALLAGADRAVFTRCQNPRSLSPATLESLAAKVADVPGETSANPQAALARARELAGARGAVLATGSIYLIADLVRDAGAVRASVL